MIDPLQDPDVWTIEEALVHIRAVEPALRKTYHCFLGLCGGVLRNGRSSKDLDLILIPLNGDTKPDPEGAKKYLETVWGTRMHEGITGFNQTYLPLSFCQYKDKKIDLITIKNCL